MLDVSELEKQWSKYHFKKMLPRYIGAFFLLTLTGVGGFFANKHKNELLGLLNQTPKLEKTLIKAKDSNSSTISNEPAIEEVYVQNILYPSYTFLEPLELAYIKYNNAQKIALLAASKKKAYKKRKPKAKKKKVKKPSKPAKKTVVKPKTKKVIDTLPSQQPVPVVAIVSTTSPKVLVNGSTKSKVPKAQAPSQAIIKVGSTATSEDEIRSIIKRFNRKKKPALSLFIARKYYEIDNFEGAYKYANETYKLNKNIEAATIIYAKSAVKLGKKEDALNRLNQYLEKNSSHKVTTLRDDIIKGTFQ